MVHIYFEIVIILIDWTHSCPELETNQPTKYLVMLNLPLNLSPPSSIFCWVGRGRTVAQVRNVTLRSEEWGAAARGRMCLTVKGMWWGREAPPSSVRPNVSICSCRPRRQGTLSCRRQSRYNSSLDRETDRERLCHSPSHRGAAWNLWDRPVRIIQQTWPVILSFSFWIPRD